MRTPMTASDASAFPLRRYGGVRCRLIFHPSYSSTGYPDARRCACLRPHSVTTENTRGEARHGAWTRIGGRDGGRWRLDARRMTAEADPLQDDCGGRTRRAFSRNSPRRFPVRAGAPRHVPPRGQHDAGAIINFKLQRLARTQSALVTSQYFCFAKTDVPMIYKNQEVRYA